MKIRRVGDGTTAVLEIAVAQGWAGVGRVFASLAPPISAEDLALWSQDAIALLAAPAEVRARLAAAAASFGPEADNGLTPLIPFAPRSFRDFMLYERHAIDAARGFVRRFMPHAWPIVRAYEATLGAPFPALRPHRLWYKEPLYYMGNHLAFVGNDAAVAIPSYTQALDYELELGFVIVRELFNATPAEAEAAIGGFVVVNDFSARDVQADEMRSGFGPQKAKHFRNAMSAVLVSADEILPRWRDLKGFVRLNGALIAEPSSAGPKWSIGEAIAHASRSERLYPGELFATGTLPGGSGIETGHLLQAGDRIEIGVEGVGTLTNTIVAAEVDVP